MLSRYALERLLYRIGQSRYSDQFVLKGAMLFLAWMSETHRPTRDLDLLGRGESSPESSKAIFRELCAISANDGIAFDENSVQSERIREDELRRRSCNAVGDTCEGAYCNSSGHRIW